MDQSIDPFLQTDEGAEISEALHFAFNSGSNGILLFYQVPGIGGGLLHSEGDLAARRIHIQHRRLDLITDGDHTRRMADFVSPGHLRHMYEAFHTRFDFHERTVIREADHTALDTGPDGILGRYIGPRIRCLLLEAQRNPARFSIVLEHRDLHPVTDIEHFRRMADSSPRHIRDVEQAVDTAQIDKGPVVRDVLDGPLNQLSFL